MDDALIYQPKFYVMADIRTLLRIHDMLNRVGIANGTDDMGQLLGTYLLWVRGDDKQQKIAQLIIRVLTP